MAVVGGLLGIAGAFVAEARAVTSIPLTIVGPPIAEELLKPIGIYVLLLRWPYLIRSQLGLALLTALSGLIFGLLESTVYVTVFAPDYERWFFVYRFSIPVAMHTTSSFIAGLGVNQLLIDWAWGGKPFPKPSLGAFLAAIALHTSYNVIAVALVVAGVLHFE